MFITARHCLNVIRRFTAVRFDSNELVDIQVCLESDPVTYIVDVHGFDTEGAGTDFDLYVWTVGTTDNLGNPTITALGWSYRWQKYNALPLAGTALKHSVTIRI